MGCLPIMITFKSNNVFLERGCVDYYSAVARDHNLKLQHELFLMQLNFSNPAGTKISYIDIYRPLDDMIHARGNLGKLNKVDNFNPLIGYICSYNKEMYLPN